MNIYSISSLLASATCILAGIFVYFKGRDKKINKLLASVNVLIGLWCLFPFITSIIPDNAEALLASRIIYLAAIFCPAVFAHFAFTFCNYRKPVLYFYIFSIILLIFLPTPFFIKGITRLKFQSTVNPGLLFHSFILFFGVACGWPIYKMFDIYKHATGIKRNQFKYVFLSFVTAFIGGLIHFSPIYTGIDEPIPHDFLIITFILILSYAIVKHHLMDIRLAITRVGIFLAIYILLLGIPFSIGYFSGHWVISALLLTVFAGTGPFIFRYLQKKTDEFLFKENQKYQKIILESSEEILNLKDKNILLERAISLIFDNVMPSFGALYLLERGDFPLKVSLPRTVSLPSTITRKNPLIENLSRHRGTSFDFNLENTLVSLAVSIGRKEQIKGILLLGEKRQKEVYSKQDIETFRTLLNQVSLALENIQHIHEAIEEHAEKERLKKEMEMAKQIQMNLLPQVAPQTKGFHIEGLLVPATEVAGDYYDFISYSPENLGIVVADVSGKGLDSGMVMSMTKSTVYTLAQQKLSPRELVINLNKILCAQLRQQKFISLIYGVYDSIAHTFTWGGAGHEHVIVCRKKGEPKVEMIRTDGVVLGMLEDIDDKIPQKNVFLNEGDKIILYTDGVTEARNTEENMFSLKRLGQIIEQAPDLPAKDLLEYIKNQIQDFIKGAPQYDDITLVVLSRD